ncbi:hypothetical protein METBISCDRAFT_25367 [Metschnikowia bicuspidata]|uniref:RBR-type E3 ubiquitin transferase n=1 Tax=Metschnikowia bicuspidata TaxID=27322 RepID=A0A4P9ZHZ0_9ASCO|nr:hypothetical protein METBISCDRAFT_25367 [Metschnikowia bicuspidata]
MSDETGDYDSDLSFKFDDDGYSSDEAFEGRVAKLSLALPSPNHLSKLTFRSFSMETFILESLVEKAEELKSQFLVQFLVDELLIMLQHKNWLKLEVLSEYYDNWPRFRDACGLTDTRGEKHKFRQIRDFTCPICCETGDLVVFSLLCQHEFCSPCYQKYVESAAFQNDIIRCMEPLCHFALLHTHIVALFGARDGQKRLAEELRFQSGKSEEIHEDNEHVNFSQDAGVDDQPSKDLKSLGTSFSISAELFFDIVQFSGTQHSTESDAKSKYPFITSYALLQAVRSLIDAKFQTFRWCPAHDCNEVIELESAEDYRDVDYKTCSQLKKVPIVLCNKSHEFCFNCQYENHLPLPCELASRWITKCSDDSETLNWLQVNTQSCPKCHALIEKNGGCNHITCKKCAHEFCWICFGDWTLHKSNNWVCSRYDHKAVKNIADKNSKRKQSLSRYLHHYKRFAVHQVSMTGDYKTLATLQAQVINYMKHRPLEYSDETTWNDVQFLSNLYRGLCAGRRTLMWSYVFTFFLKQNNFSAIFESMQDFLNDTVEKLSQLFETFKKLDPSKASLMLIGCKREKFKNLTSLVLQRRRMLINHASKCLEEGDMAFVNHIDL